MPVSAPRPCTWTGCKRLVSGASRCEEHRRTADKQRGTSSERGYGYAWQVARMGYLRLHPLCVQCKREGRLEPATDVDHVVPHRGDQVLFWDQDNWQSLCHPCHSSKTASEDGGFSNTRKPPRG